MCEAVDKSEWHSRQVADNAVTLHRWSAPDCTTIRAYACGDHFHIGHLYRAAGDACKAAHVFTRPPHPGRHP